MILSVKICGVSDHETLNYLLCHSFPPKFIGFISNYEKSKRFIEFHQLKELVNVNKKKINFTSVLVSPSDEILEKIKDLNFDYYQLYDCSPNEIQSIKNKYNKKIITAFTVKNSQDVKKSIQYKDVTDIYLFDSKGYEKSMSFKHSLIENIEFDKKIMLAGNIQIYDNLKNYYKIADIIDISGGLETSGLKDISKIEFFLNKVKETKNEA